MWPSDDEQERISEVNERPTNVVIGAGSGMGTAIARRLAGSGRLLLADRDLESVTSLAAGLEGEVDTIACDITDPVGIASLVETTGTLGSPGSYPPACRRTWAPAAPSSRST